nr:PAS domain S-box protein [uncultured Methanoregula sp.]
MACVVVLFAYLFTRSRLFIEVLENKPAIMTQVTLALIFGLLSIFGMSSGIVFYGAVVNVRDLGPLIAGFICGPYVGLGAGIIGGAYRISVGGANVYAAALGPVIAGAVSGLVYNYNRKTLVSTKNAVILTIVIESFISVLALMVRILAGDPPLTIWTILVNVALPMIIMTSAAVGVFTHIAHNLLLERKLQKENQQLAIEHEAQKNLGTIINTIADPVFVKDRNHLLILVNEGFCHLFGHSREELIGKTEYDFFPQAQADRFRENAEAIFLSGTESENEETFTGPDGQEHTIVTKINPYLDSSGNRFLVGIIRDISDRKKMEDALKASEERYRTVFETTGTSTILFEENTVISLVNAEFERLSGYSKEEIEGKMSWTGFVYPEDRDRVIAQYPKMRDRRESSAQHYEFRFRTRTGDVRTLDLFIGAIPGTTRFVASMVDITDTIRSRKILEMVNKKINLLSSITRHDILNQLMVLKGYLSLSTTMVENPVLLDYINRELAATQTIEHQITFTRDYENLGVKAPGWQSVNGAILKAKHALVRREISVETDPRDPYVYADPLFEKVLYNLTDNALRYGGDQMTSIRVISTEFDQGLVIYFEDNGTGISEPDKKRLFKRGFGKNTGFGLFLSREILSITGITINETGIYGEGARFEITVPKGVYRLENQ